MCGSIVDIESTAAEIRRGKKERRKKDRKIEITGQKFNGLPYYIERTKTHLKKNNNYYAQSEQK